MSCISPHSAGNASILTVDTLHCAVQENDEQLRGTMDRLRADLQAMQAGVMDAQVGRQVALGWVVKGTHVQWCPLIILKHDVQAGVMDAQVGHQIMFNGFHLLP